MAIFKDLGASAYVATIVGVIFVGLLPYCVDLFTLLQITVYLLMAVLALSLALAWGTGGILCFGQAAFFGLGGYAYSIAALNLGDTTLAVVVSMLVPAAFAALIGYFMFSGRLNDLYVGVITLCSSLILFNFANSTSDPWYAIGNAALNGYNGISSVPTLNMPFDPASVLSPEATFYVTGGILISVYFLCRVVVSTSYGRVLVAIRQNETRAELLGYNVAMYKLSLLVLSAAIAGLAGCLYANWGAFISPNVFSMSTTAQTIIWIIIGGRETFVGPVLGAVFIQMLSMRLGSDAIIDINLLMGALLMVFVVAVPNGILPTIGVGLAKMRQIVFGKRYLVRDNPFGGE
jgi:ABC-type branched-subunit amino acid transport system permease subunit